MSEARRKREDLQRITGQLREALEVRQAEASTRDRDSAILRFELAYEVCWKLLQFLAREQGLESNGPRQAIENAFSLGWIGDESLWFDLIKDRNLAFHVYHEPLANALHARLPGYLNAFESLLEQLPE